MEYLHLLNATAHGQSRVIPTFETVDKIEAIPCFIPARWISFEGERRDRDASGLVPAKEIMEFFDLNIDLPTWRTADTDGVIHSFASREGSTENTERYLFFRRDRLDQLSREQRLSRIRDLGERQYYTDRLTPVSENQRYKYFQNHWLYEPEGTGTGLADGDG